MGIQVQLIILAIMAVLSFSSGWTVHDWRTKSNTADALRRQAALNDMISEQDSEITMHSQEHIKTIYLARGAAHETLNNSTVPTCSLDADGLRAVQSVYTGTETRAGALVAAVRGVEAPSRRTFSDDK